MNLNEYTLFIDGHPVVRSSENPFPDTRSKNQKKKDRKEYFKNKRKQRGSITFELPLEKPWHERIVIKGDR